MMNFRAVSLFIFFCIFSSKAPALNKRCRIEIVNKNNRVIFLDVEIADTEEKRALGLMFRKYLPENKGMLFLFGAETYLNFWMKNTFIPLSIAYISSEGIINEIYQMKPLDISVTYPSKLPAGYALEVNRGWFHKNNISTGSIVKLNGCIGK